MAGGHAEIVDFSRSWSLSVDPAGGRRQAVDHAARVAGFTREGSRRIVVVVSPDTGARGPTTVRAVREIPTGAERAALAVVGRFLAAEQIEVWQPVDGDGVVTARIDITFPDRPIAVTAGVVLRPAPPGCEYTITGAATVRLPGIGRLVERRIVGGILAALEAQWGATPVG